MTDEIAGKPRVPVDELRELVEEWKREHQRRKYGDREEAAWGIGHDRCADELKEAIERYELGELER